MLRHPPFAPALFVIASTALALLSPVEAVAKAPRPCWVPSRLLYSGRTTLEYTPAAEAQTREDAAAALERREPREIHAGWIAVEIDRTTLDGADPAHQLVLVTQNGQEIIRHEPISEIPEMNPEIPGFWYAYATLQLPDGTTLPLEVEVIDRLQQIACRWEIDTDGTVTLSRSGAPKRKTDESAATTRPRSASTSTARTASGPRRAGAARR
jgi:hypothetical protein